MPCDFVAFLGFVPLRAITLTVVVIVLITVTKVQELLQEEEFALPYSWRGYRKGIDGGMCEAGSIASAVRKQRAEGFHAIKPPNQSPVIRPIKAPPPKGPTAFQNSTSSWGPRFQNYAQP